MGRQRDGWEEGKQIDKLTVEQLTVVHGGTALLQDVSLSIEAGRTTVLMGPSGSGKSTLLKMLNRLDLEEGQLSATGSIRLEGEELLRALSPWERALLRRRVGMVFQQPMPFPKSIYENIAYGIRLHERLPKQQLEGRVEEALRRAALWEEVRDRLGEDARRLSGGQQQRLCIARALAVYPEVLLLDEPTSALDPLSTQRVEALLRSLRGRMTLVLVTHQQAQAKRVGDRLVQLEQGRIVAEG